MSMTRSWRDAILENVPHGEDSFLNLDKENAIKLCDILLQKGYAVCLTGGDIGDDIKVAWLYAGDTSSLNSPNYNNVVFTHTDYIIEYPEAVQDLYAEEDLRLEEGFGTHDYNDLINKPQINSVELECI